MNALLAFIAPQFEGRNGGPLFGLRLEVQFGIGRPQHHK